MGLHHLNVTLGAAATQASTTRIPVKWVGLESETGNADVQVGDSNVTASSYGFTLVAGPANIRSMGPFSGELPFNLSELYLLGTATEVVHVTYLA